MRLVSFAGGFGRIEGDAVVPMGRSLVEWLRTGEVHDGAPLPIGDVHLTAPVPRPGKILCIGLNYRDHAEESGQPIPTAPVVFAKFANAVVGPGADVVVPPSVEQVDYEAELAVVIGRRARRISSTLARSYIAGYACCNDVSSRALQFSSSQWTMGKAVDTFLPLGPHLVTADEVDDPEALGIRCYVNGELRQSSTTSELIFGVAELVSYLSSAVTLEPGDVIATGTPAGVGFSMQPPRWLAPGDETTVEIDGLGALTNTIRAEGSDCGRVAPGRP